MREINIKVVIENNKIAIFRQLLGFDKTSITDNFEIAGILEHIVDEHKKRIKNLVSYEK